MILNCHIPDMGRCIGLFRGIPLAGIRTASTVAVTALLLFGLGASQALAGNDALADLVPPTPDARLGYIYEFPPETPEQNQARHALVAQRRADLPIICHRGADRYAPENTMEAYSFAIDYGAYGIEIDPRRSKDGILYIMHDDTFDRTTNCTGRGQDKNYYDMLACPIRGLGITTRVPTLIAILEMARQRGALIHLDMKEDVEQDFMRLMTWGDMWDHLILTNNGSRIMAQPSYRPLVYKSGVPSPNWSPQQLADYLASPGNMIFIGNHPTDPRPAATALGRAIPGPQPIPLSLYAWWLPDGTYIPVPTDPEPVTSSASLQVH